MSKHNSFYETVYGIINDGVAKGIIHLNTEDKQLIGNSFQINNKLIVNFGSCSYLGLEFDSRMKEAAKAAIDDYGTQFSASRAYVSSRHYVELEEQFGKIFDSSCLVAPTTTLGHIATIPLIINDDDAIILDHQVHNSVQTAVNLIRPRGISVEIIRHNNMQMLEDKIKILRQRNKRIWYMADGIYSMYGDYTPVDEVYALMDKYPELHYYVDDAHGMSCYGKHGRGYVLSKQPIHEKMAFTTSLAKAFATGGAVISFKDPKLVNKIRSCGGPMLSSGPMQPAALGAAIAAANIHLSDEIYGYQSKLQENIKFCNMMLNKAQLPLVAESSSPVFFVGVSLPKMAYNMIQRMLKEGYYLNLGIFPTVPIKNTGLRFTITSLHTFKQIEDMVSALAYHYPLALEEEQFSMDKIYQAFKMPMPEERIVDEKVETVVNQSLLIEEYKKSIADVSHTEWNTLLGNRGSFSVDGLKLLEKTFTGNIKSDDNWKFDYIILREPSGKPILATFLTTAISKDDMLSPAGISRQIEEIREKQDPFYLTSLTVMMGSQLTEGEHLYLDKTSKYWKDALRILFEKINELQEKYGATMISLRDFNTMDEELDSLLVDNGYFKAEMPENHVVENKFPDFEEYLNTLSYKSRKNVRYEILRFENSFETEVAGNDVSDEEILKWYKMYLDVKVRNLYINTFALPLNLFKNIVKDKNWEILKLKVKPEFRVNNEELASITLSYKGKLNYSPILMGINYNYIKNLNCYKQSLYRLIVRGRELNLDTVRLGFGATVEKSKLGAKVIPTYAYIQAKDNYNLTVISSMSVTETVKIQPKYSHET